MKTAPTLFHDIDGVLFGDYAGEFQLRPGVNSWLAWAHEHFEVIWLTSWESEKIKTLLSVLYCGKLLQQSGDAAVSSCQLDELREQGGLDPTGHAEAEGP